VRFKFLENMQQLQNHLACYFLLNKSWIPVHYLGQNLNILVLHNFISRLDGLHVHNFNLQS